MSSFMFNSNFVCYDFAKVFLNDFFLFETVNFLNISTVIEMSLVSTKLHQFLTSSKSNYCGKLALKQMYYNPKLLSNDKIGYLNIIKNGLRLLIFP